MATALIEQLDKEISAIEQKGISINNIDILYKLVSTRANCHNFNIVSEYKETLYEEKKYNNNVYDKDINTLYARYKEKRMKYCNDKTEQNKIEMVDSLSELFAEIEDLIHDIWSSALCWNEREQIENLVKRIGISS